MASTNSWTLEFESQVAASRKFRACVMDWHNLAPKITPHIADNTHHVEGDGSVTHYKCGSDVPFNAIKKKVEFIDVDKCECKYTIECDGVDTGTWHIKMKPKANGGSVATVECTHKGAEGKDMMRMAKDSATEMFKAVEAYLVANPDACK